MANSSFLNRVSGIDFFAILAPGFYIFTVLYSTALAFDKNLEANSTFWSMLNSISDSISENLVYLIFIFFAAYLIGSVLRAIPVWLAEKIVRPRAPSNFPYPDVLSYVLMELKHHEIHSGINDEVFPDFEGTFSPRVFDFWKHQLCVNSKDGFLFYRSFETRSRFFAGIVWASYIGVLFGIIICSSPINFHPINSLGGPILYFSLILAIAFGYNFRRIRRQEVHALLLAYLSLEKRS